MLCSAHALYSYHCRNELVQQIDTVVGEEGGLHTLVAEKAPQVGLNRNYHEDDRKCNQQPDAQVRVENQETDDGQKESDEGIGNQEKDGFDSVHVSAKQVLDLSSCKDKKFIGQRVILSEQGIPKLGKVKKTNMTYWRMRSC